MIEIVKYKNNMNCEWDSFIDTSINGTIFHRRSFLSYHIDRKFEDASLIFKKRGQIISVFPAAITKESNKRVLFSHPGASFGSLVYDSLLSFKDSMNIVSLLKKYAYENKFNIIRATLPPIIYSALPSDYFEFCLLSAGGYYEKSEMSSVLNLGLSADRVEENIKSSHKQAKRKAERNGIMVKQSNDYDKYYSILANNLELRHGVSPTHSLEELKKIVKLFPDKVFLHTAHYNKKMIAGILNFICNKKTLLAFYICHNYNFQDLRPLNLIFFDIFNWAIKRKYQYYDLGIFTINERPNYGLARFKENFGACGFFRKTLRIDI